MQKLTENVSLPQINENISLIIDVIKDSLYGDESGMIIDFLPKNKIIFRGENTEGIYKIKHKIILELIFPNEEYKIIPLVKHKDNLYTVYFYDDYTEISYLIFVLFIPKNKLTLEHLLESGDAIELKNEISFKTVDAIININIKRKKIKITGNINQEFTIKKIIDNKIICFEDENYEIYCTIKNISNNNFLLRQAVLNKKKEVVNFVFVKLQKIKK